MLTKQEQITDSFNRRGLHAKRVLKENLDFAQGLTKLKTYLLQHAPGPDGKPFMIIPFSEELLSLFSFSIGCPKKDEPADEAGEVACKFCYGRNECLRKIMQKIERSARKAGVSKTIDQMLNDWDEDLQTHLSGRLSLYNFTALLQLRSVILNLAQERK